MSNEVDLHQLIEVIGDAVVVSNVAGKITLWNHAAEDMFGYTAREALGQNLDIITPERFRARYWEGYHHSMWKLAPQSTESKLYEYRRFIKMGIRCRSQLPSPCSMTNTTKLAVSLR